ncbi:MAG: DEAD/DEAH box helicase, partial [Verrucomicrobia bacterium]|nr:DEAD/DEAH box helicase [Verrucomicrobiota bacterium]
AIDCQLQPIYRGSKTEQCVVRVLAHSPDGDRQESWNGQTWVNTTPVQGHSATDDDHGILTVFDRSAAHDVARVLEPLSLKRDPYTGALALRVTKKFPDLFASWLKSVPPHISVQLAGDLASFAGAAVSGRVRLDVTEAAIDWFDLHVVLDVSDTTLTPAEIKLLLNAKGGYVRLSDKGWRRLQFDLSQEEDERLARIGLNPHELTAEPQRLHALQLADESARKFLPAQQADQIQRRAGEIKARVTPDLPAGVLAELRPYQLEGFHFLAYLAANHFGGILADDMGLGKTLQALAWLLYLREQPQPSPSPIGWERAGMRVGGEGQGEGGTNSAAASSAPRTGHPPCLVVCPKSVMDNWHAEAARFTPSLRVKAWPAGELEHLPARLGEADLHVLNYSQLRLLGESLVPISWQVVILDEGQYIKNPGSQTAQVARALRAEHRLILSGTPIENRLLDLWSLMAFAMPGALGSRSQFARLFGAKDDPFARRRLSARVRPFLLRRTKTQVAKDLPDRVEEDLFCEIEGEQKSLYRAELKRAQQMLLRVQTQKQLAEERFSFLASLLRLRQICCHPALVDHKSKAPSAKLEALLEQIEPLMEEGHKVLVFSQFVQLLALLKPAIAERKWPMFYLAGETENRGKLVKDFQSAQGAAVFLISL